MERSAFIQHIIDMAKASPRRIVLPEGGDARVLEAAHTIAQEGIAAVILLGDEQQIARALVIRVVALKALYLGHQLFGASKSVEGQRRSVGQYGGPLDDVAQLAHVARPTVCAQRFDGRVREYFQLERLWGDAGRLDIAPVYFTDPEVAKRHPDVNFSMPGSPGEGSPD